MLKVEPPGYGDYPRYYGNDENRNSVENALAILGRENFPSLQHVIVRSKNVFGGDGKDWRGPYSIEMRLLSSNSAFRTLKVINLLLLPKEVIAMRSANDEGSEGTGEFETLAHLTSLSSITLHMSSEANTSFNADGSLGALSALKHLQMLNISPLAQEKGISELTTLTKLNFRAQQRPSFPACSCYESYDTNEPIFDCNECIYEAKVGGWQSVDSMGSDLFYRLVVQYGDEISQLPLLRELWVNLGYKHSRHKNTTLQPGQHGPQDPNAICNRFQIPKKNQLESLRHVLISGYSHATSCIGNGTSSLWDATLHNPTVNSLYTLNDADADDNFTNLAYRTDTPEIISTFFARVPSLTGVRLTPSDVIPENEQGLGSANEWLRGPLQRALAASGCRADWSYSADVKGTREVNSMKIIVTVKKSN